MAISWHIWTNPCITKPYYCIFSYFYISIPAYYIHAYLRTCFHTCILEYLDTCYLHTFMIACRIYVAHLLSSILVYIAPLHTTR